MNIDDATREAARLSHLLDAALTMLKDQIRLYAEAERDYRKAKAAAWVNTEGTAKEREAVVDGQTAELRYQRDIADHMRQACLEAIRSRRAQVSALQSLLAAHREEAAFARTGPEVDR